MDEVPWVLALSALGTGAVFGYVLQRGGFCLTRALSNAVLMRDGNILRAYLLALLVAMVGVQVIETLGLVDIPLRPLRWLSNIVGGGLFGVGMILAGGCSGSTWYRVGEGAVGAWVVLLGFAIGATTAGVGLLAPLRAQLQKPVVTIGDGGAPTLANVVGISPWVAILVLALGVGVWLTRGPREPEHGKWPWPVTGAAVGVVIALGWWTSAFGDRPVGITFAANTGHLLTYPMIGYPNRVTWSMLMALGVPIGSFLAAWTADQFAWKLPAAPSLIKIFGGGLLMGAAALVAEGCNINQGLTNSATLALGSLLTFASMCGGACLTLWLLFLRKS
ncbi:MAG TPA: YeeE/YedE family protein [Methylomirabilota bacterium]|nr:YeeE/YedE family protein [Methylomirabilota bacterium]